MERHAPESGRTNLALGAFGVLFLLRAFVFL
jgi:hypothetical protein